MEVAPLAFFALFVVLVLAFGLYGIYRRGQRREEAATWAFRNQLEFSQSDPFDLAAHPFRLFSKGDERGCENVMWGRFKNLPIRAADYWYYEERSDSDGSTTRDYSHFSIVTYDIEVNIPRVYFQPESLWTRLADHLTFRDIDLESEEFNRAWQVKSDDRAFAFKLIDARMMHWLMNNGTGFGFEGVGSSVLVYCKRKNVDELRLLLEVARSFRDQIPQIVWTEYGGAAERR